MSVLLSRSQSVVQFHHPADRRQTTWQPRKDQLIAISTGNAHLSIQPLDVAQLKRRTGMESVMAVNNDNRDNNPGNDKPNNNPAALEGPQMV